MKFKKALFFSLFIFASTFVSNAQTFRAAIIAGGNFSQIDGDDLAGFDQAGLHLGGTVMIPFYNNWSAAVEILYSQKGMQSTQNKSFPDNNIDLRLDYVELPVMIRYTDKDKFTGGVGVSYSRFLSSKYVRNSILYEPELPDGVFKESDIMLKIDGGYFITKNFYVNAGWATSFTKTNEINTESQFDAFDLTYNPRSERDEDEITYKNRLIFARLMYVLPIGAAARN